MIYTNELREIMDFYVNILGFTCGEYNGNFGLHLYTKMKPK